MIDTGFAIHLQSEGVSKGTALVALARDMGLSPKDFFAIGDGINDAQMLEQAGRGVTIANAHPETKAAASDVMEDGYGKGFISRKKVFALSSGKVTVNDDIVLDVFYRLKGDDQQVAVFQCVTVGDKGLVRVDDQVENLP